MWTICAPSSPKMRSRSKSFASSSRPISPARSFPDPRSARSGSAIRHVDLVAVSPRSALVDVGTLVIHVTTREVVLDEARHRAAVDEGGQDLHRQSEIGRNTAHIRLRTARGHLEHVRAVERLTVNRSKTGSHAGRDHHRVLAVLLEFDSWRLLNRFARQVSGSPESRKSFANTEIISERGRLAR